VTLCLGETLLVRWSRWGPRPLSSVGSRRSKSHKSSRRVNSLGTPSRTRPVRVLSLRNSGRLVVCLRTGSRIGIGSLDTWVRGRFDRRPGSLGSAWSHVRFSKYKRKRGGECIAKETRTSYSLREVLLPFTVTKSVTNQEIPKAVAPRDTGVNN
jgi:hypothetical protein